MDTDKHRWDVNTLTEHVIGCAFKVSNALGHGFLEKVYENALLYELRKTGLKAESQKCLSVIYDGCVVGDYVADIIVESKLLIELKAAKGLDDVHMAQCINYLKATNLNLCLLINFGEPKVQIKRIAY